MTSTRINYSASGLDEIIHDYGQESQYSLEADIVGPNWYVNAQSGLDGSIEALLGISNLADVENVFKWISEKKPFLWRSNAKPNKKDVRALVLGVGDGSSFGIDAKRRRRWARTRSGPSQNLLH